MMQFEINLDFNFSYQFPVNPQKFEGWSLAEWGCLMLLMAYGESSVLGGFHIYLRVILNTSLLPCPVAMQGYPLGLQRSPRWCKPQERWDLRLACGLGPIGTAYSKKIYIYIDISLSPSLSGHPVLETRKRDWNEQLLNKMGSTHQKARWGTLWNQRTKVQPWVATPQNTTNTI